MKRTGLTLAIAASALHALPVMAEEAKTGLPQLDTSLFPGQLFWLAITFGLLYVLMAFVALPGVRRTKDTRAGKIKAELAAATAANEQAKAMIAQTEKALADARSKAHAAVAEIKLQTGKESLERQAAQQKQLHQKLHEAETKITAARDAALKDVKAAATDLADTIVEKIAGVKVRG